MPLFKSKLDKQLEQLEKEVKIASLKTKKKDVEVKEKEVEIESAFKDTSLADIYDSIGKHFLELAKRTRR